MKRAKKVFDRATRHKKEHKRKVKLVNRNMVQELSSFFIFNEYLHDLIFIPREEEREREWIKVKLRV